MTRVVHRYREPYDVYIGRPTPWSNPFMIGPDGTRAVVIQKYREWLHQQPELMERMRRELPGKVLGCYCRPKTCHGDVILEVLDGK